MSSLTFPLPTSKLVTVIDEDAQYDLTSGDVNLLDIVNVAGQTAQHETVVITVVNIPADQQEFMTADLGDGVETYHFSESAESLGCPIGVPATVEDVAQSIAAWLDDEFSEFLENIVQDGETVTFSYQSTDNITNPAVPGLLSDAVTAIVTIDGRNAIAAGGRFLVVDLEELDNAAGYFALVASFFNVQFTSTDLTDYEVPENVWFGIPFETVTTNTSNATVEDGVVTIPEDGIYMLDVKTVLFGNLITDYMQFGILLNNGPNGLYRALPFAGTPPQGSFVFTSLLQLTAGDTIQFAFYTDAPDASIRSAADLFNYQIIKFK